MAQGKGTRGYVNIKVFQHKVPVPGKEAGDIPAAEVSVAFPLYSNVHRIAGAHYQIFPSDQPAYETVIEEDKLNDWITENDKFFTPAGG